METSIKLFAMFLSKKALDLSYKILANVQVKDYSAHLDNVKFMLETTFLAIYIKARDDERNNKKWDPLIQARHNIDE